MVTTRELTTPIEYGGQWIEHVPHFHGEVWINWQKLNTPTQREQFEVGTCCAVTWAATCRWARNSSGIIAAASCSTRCRSPTITPKRSGRRYTTRSATFGPIALSAWEMFSTGHVDPFYPAGRPDNGHGTYLKASVTPGNWAQLFVIHWIGKDYNADAGDNNYNSTGYDTTFYQPHRVYTEMGFIRRTTIDHTVTFDAEFRFHNIDNLKSVAFFNTRWEISYRLVVRAPIDVLVRR